MNNLLKKNTLCFLLLFWFINPLLSQSPCPEYDQLLKEAIAMEKTDLSQAIDLYEAAKVCNPMVETEIDEMIIKVLEKKRQIDEIVEMKKARAKAREEAEARAREEVAERAKLENEVGSAYVPRMPMFPFPPPKASASHIFDNDLFSGINSLTQSSERIENALKKSGYYEKSYYQIPNGYALVTRIEKMEFDGAPAAETERWNVNDTGSSGSFDFLSYFKSLFTAETGHYRIIVFLVTSDDVQMTERVMLMSEGQDFLSSGLNRLPSEFDIMPFTEDHYCTALIYEWYKVEHEDPKFMEPSKILGYYHLAKNKFVEYLSK
jgi:hypothetical protein